jgi:hypothetical protein
MKKTPLKNGARRSSGVKERRGYRAAFNNFFLLI